MKPKRNKYYLLNLDNTYWSLDLQRMVKFVDKLVVKCISNYNDQLYFGNLVNTSEVYDDVDTSHEIQFTKDDIISEYKFHKVPLIYMDFPLYKKD